MSSRHVTVGADAFAKGIQELIGDIPDACQEKAGEAVAQSTRRGAKLLRGQYTEGIGVHPWSEEYRKGFRSHVEKGEVTVGEVGNKAKPGLVHLLENGHATLTGRRTRKFPHMDPAFEDMQEDFVGRMKKAVGEALR